MAERFYYPRGPFGPICDTILPDDGGDRVQRLDDDDDGDKLIPIDGGPRPQPVVPEPWPQPIVKCKTRTLDDGTIEYYDCETQYDKDTDDGEYDGETCIKDTNGECYDWIADSTDEFGLDDDFFVPEVGPISCNPFDSDINIRPLKFTSRDSNNAIILQDKYACEKSSPVTYPVNAIIGQTTGSMDARFSDDGRSIVVDGESTGNIELTLNWDDNPNTNGTALGTIEVGGVSFTQAAGVETGTVTASIDVTGGQLLPLTFTNLNPANNVIKVQNGGRELCLKDGDNDDCNATFTIGRVDGGSARNVSLWSDEADKYAAWTNPAQCTLPCIPQNVTYRVYFPTSDTYYFEFGADDTGSLFLDSESTPFATAGTPSMLNRSFANAGPPTVVAKDISAGIHLLTVNVTNSAAGVTNEEVSYVSSAGTLVIGNQTVGTVSAGPGTAIRTELDGFPDTSGNNRNEVGGFDVPSDSPTRQYLSFGTIQPTTTTTSLRTASITMDLRDTNAVKFDIIAGDDNNGGERPNDVADVLEVNMGNGWIVLAPSKQYANMSFDQYDRTYGNWFTFELTVPVASRVDNFTIQFRSAGDFPEIGGTYNGLAGSAFAAAYADCADVFGLYRVTRLYQTSGTCGEIDCSGLTGANAYMRFVRDVEIKRTDGSSSFADLGYENPTDQAVYYYPIVRAIAAEYISGRFGRTTGEFTNRGRAPDVGGMNTYVVLYLTSGGQLNDNPVNSTVFDTVKAAIADGYINLGEADLADIQSIEYPECESAGYGIDSYDWSKNPGGWYIKVCRGAPCRGAQSLPWIRSGPHVAWGDLMNSYAVWPVANDSLAGVDQTLVYNIFVEKDATLQLDYAADNVMDIVWDNTVVVNQHAGFITADEGSTTFATTKGEHTLTMKVTNTPKPSGDDSWSGNPAGGAWVLSYQDSATATFDANGALVVTGTGSITISLSLEWDDNPNTYGTALGTYAVFGDGGSVASLTQTPGVESGAASAEVNVTGGQTYTPTISGNSNGFTRRNGNTELCFKDGHGDDCNARIRIVNVAGGVIRKSTDLTQTPDSNLYWHTRMGTGYGYSLNRNCNAFYTP